jgi:hypothetical protein
LTAGNNWFEPFGFCKGILDPQTGAMPDLFEETLVLVGTVDTVTRLPVERPVEEDNRALLHESPAASERRPAVLG